MAACPLPIAVLISGGGRTLRNFLDRVAARILDVDIRLVVSTHPDAGGLAHAREAGIPTHVRRRRDFGDGAAFTEAILGPCRDAGVRLVAMAGFIHHVDVPDDFQHRIVNIHPALIPAFCGQGFYGARVHRAALDYGVKITGCTVHFVDDQYDHGPIILQRSVPVQPDDTPETLAARVFRTECDLYPHALQLLAEDRVEVGGRQVRIAGAAREKPSS